MVYTAEVTKNGVGFLRLTCRSNNGLVNRLLNCACAPGNIRLRLCPLPLKLRALSNTNTTCIIIMSVSYAHLVISDKRKHVVHRLADKIVIAA